jgi:hypothetical protein
MLIKTENTDLGYFLLDHRHASALPPGVTEELIEYATFTCTHCEGVVLMNPARKRHRTLCKGCNHLICDNCAEIKAQTGVCRTYKQILDELYEKEIKETDATRQAESLIVLP